MVRFSYSELLNAIRLELQQTGDTDRKSVILMPGNVHNMVSRNQ